MKKIVSIMLSIILLINTGLAYTVTIKAKGIGIRTNGGSGASVGIEAKIGEITGWEVKTGNAEITNNQFIMPESDVEIQAVTEEKYLLVIEFPGFIKREEKAEGVSVTVEAESNNAEQEFKNWTYTGIELTAEQQVSNSITFTMPAQAVTLVANYGAPAAKYTVEYNANGGTGSMSSQEFTEGIAQNLRSNEFTRSGYTFGGWSTTNNGAVE